MDFYATSVFDKIDFDFSVTQKYDCKSVNI